MCAPLPPISCAMQQNKYSSHNQCWTNCISRMKEFVFHFSYCHFVVEHTLLFQESFWLESARARKTARALARGRWSWLGKPASHAHAEDNFNQLREQSKASEWTFMWRQAKTRQIALFQVFALFACNISQKPTIFATVVNFLAYYSLYRTARVVLLLAHS